MSKYPALSIYKSLYNTDFYFLPILNILVPQDGHIPCVAGLPFFMVMDLGSFISFLARHFTQYACIDFLLPSKLFGINNKLLLRSCQEARTNKHEFYHTQNINPLHLKDTGGQADGHSQPPVSV